MADSEHICIVKNDGLQIKNRNTEEIVSELTHTKLQVSGLHIKNLVHDVNVTGISNDVTLAADSATSLVTEHAVKQYVDGSVAPMEGFIAADAVNWWTPGAFPSIPKVQGWKSQVGICTVHIPLGDSSAETTITLPTIALGGPTYFMVFTQSISTSVAGVAALPFIDTNNLVAGAGPVPAQFAMRVQLPVPAAGDLDYNFLYCCMW